MKYKDILDNKLELMAIATLLIMLFHLDIPLSNNVLYFIRRYGFIGVDLFFLVSGMGCLYSYHKNSNKKVFYQKRILRILPTYLPITIIGYFLLVKLKYMTSIDYVAQVT